MRRVAACALAFGALTFGTPMAVADPVAPPAAAAKPDVATLLFETPQWSNAPAGSTITYSYAKATTQALYGPSFDDRIVLTLEKADDAASRNVDVKMFTPPRTKPAGPFQSVAQNPVLLLALEENVEELSALWHASPRYLKNAIRKSWRDDARIESMPITVAGKQVPGTRITIEPFQNDPMKDQMGGLETMVYTVEIADSVPGQIATVDVHAPAGDKPSFSEILRYQSETKP